ncbi:MBL fold metallo-hydrolase [Phenylobacterium immobile]|uniref:MBL fold metallo-hydrolase n=1 Tax=Phenylobacterium immobile TaxID=21 RepID=UPI000A403FF0|nr:MBL fold metallo-hydrolase [Phenylobacterium immobile]
MKAQLGMALALVAGLGTAAGAYAQSEAVQPAPTKAEQIFAHKTTAKAAVGQNWDGTLGRLCTVPDNALRKSTGAFTQAIPARETWYAEPYKVFDNLYWVGTKVHSSWALTTSEGIILIDTLWHYANEDEIVAGLKTLGLDPAQVKFVIITHAHGDHDEGARMLQQRYGTKVVMSAEDWTLMDAQPDIPGGRPTRDVVVADGDKVTLGDTSVTTYLTPGHTLGTISLVFQVKDKGRPITVAYSGGTAFNFPKSVERYDTYIASQKKLAKAAADAGATILLSNHSQFDHAYDYARISQLPRKPGQLSPFEVGSDAVGRYFTVSSECAEAQKLDLAP